MWRSLVINCSGIAGGSSSGVLYGLRAAWLTGAARFWKHTIVFCGMYLKLESSQFLCGIVSAKNLGIPHLVVLRSINPHPLSN
jgi:hypothetical protein